MTALVSKITQIDLLGDKKTNNPPQKKEKPRCVLRDDTAVGGVRQGTAVDSRECDKRGKQLVRQVDFSETR